MDCYTSAPREWHGERLYDWGRGGLRCHGNRYIKALGRRRKTFDTRWAQGSARRVWAGDDPQLVRRARKASREVWPVYQRRGKLWKVAYWIIPEGLVRTLS